MRKLRRVIAYFQFQNEATGMTERVAGGITCLSLVWHQKHPAVINFSPSSAPDDLKEHLGVFRPNAALQTVDHKSTLAPIFFA
jgi:hypothetical protein